MNKEFDLLRNMLERDRSVRRFVQDKPVDSDLLLHLVSLTRLCASGRNLQPLKYRIVCFPEECERIFPLLAWAGYLQDWDGPAPGEHPSAYLIQCLDTSITPNCLCDDGLQLQALTLGATALGLGGCIIKSFNLKELVSELSLPDNIKPTYVLALGYPKEEVVLEEQSGPDDFRYYRTPDGVHHVPKRPLADFIV